MAKVWPMCFLTPLHLQLWAAKILPPLLPPEQLVAKGQIIPCIEIKFGKYSWTVWKSARTVCLPDKEVYTRFFSTKENRTTWKCITVRPCSCPTPSSLETPANVRRSSDVSTEKLRKIRKYLDVQRSPGTWNFGSNVLNSQLVPNWFLVTTCQFRSRLYQRKSMEAHGE